MKKKRDFVNVIAGRVEGCTLRYAIIEQIFSGRDVLDDVRRIDRQEKEAHNAEYDAAIEDLANMSSLDDERGALARRVESAVRDQLVDNETEFLALGVALGCLLAGERPRKVRARLQTLGLYPGI